MMDGDDEDDEVAVEPPSSPGTKEQQQQPRWYRRFLRSAPLIATIRQGGRIAIIAPTIATTVTSNSSKNNCGVSGRRTAKDIKVTIRCDYRVDERIAEKQLLDNNVKRDVTTRPGSSTNDEKKVTIRPDMAISNNDDIFNKDDYAILQKRYLHPRIRSNVELPASGMILRTQTKCRWIDQYATTTPVLRILQLRIDTLLKSNDHNKVYHLLCQLRDWEMNPRCIPSSFIVREQVDEDVTEILDLTNDKDDDDNNRGSDERRHDIIDVDKYPSDSALARPLDSLSSCSIKLHTPPSKQKQQKNVCRQLTIDDCRDFYVQQQQPQKLLFQSSEDDSIYAQPSSSSSNIVRNGVVTPEKDVLCQNINLHTNLEKVKLHSCPTTDDCKKFSVIDFGFPNQCTRRKGHMRNLSTIVTTSYTTSSSRQLPTTMPTKSSEELHHRIRPTCNSINIVTLPAVRFQQHAATYANPIKEAMSLRDQWNIQGKLRKSGKWIPNGHVTGKWKPPQWAITLNTYNDAGEGDEYSNNETNDNTPKKKRQKTKKTNSGGLQCKKSLLPQLDSLMLNFAFKMRIHQWPSSSPTCLRDVICPQYVKPTINLLCSAHSAMESLLPKGDCEDWDVVALAWRYYNHWRPSETKVILLAESHAFTTKVSYCVQRLFSMNSGVIQVCSSNDVISICRSLQTDQALECYKINILDQESL